MADHTFTTLIDKKDVEFSVVSPTVDHLREAQKIYNGAFHDAIKSHAIIRAKMDDFLEEQGLWDAKKQEQFTSLQQDLLSGEKKLAQGGFGLSDAKKLALNMRTIRDQLRELISVRTQMDNNTAEGQADNSRFNYLVSVCLVYNETGKPYYKDLAEYLTRSNEQVAVLGAEMLANMMYGLDSGYETKLPENRFLKQFGFVDKQMRLINDDGELVDADGRLIDDDGRYVDKDGDYVDAEGNPVTVEGEYNFEQKPFLDEDGNPIILDDSLAAT